MTQRKSDNELLHSISQGRPGLNAVRKSDLEWYRHVIHTSSDWKVASSKSQEKAFETVMLKASISKVHHNPIISYQKMVGLVASVALLGFISWYVLNLLFIVQIEVPLGSIERVLLPDSSLVILNAGSQMSYNTHDWQRGIRSIELQGKAYFEVKKGSRFDVVSEHGSVSVLGTSFNVLDDGEYRVECFTGKVSVSLNKEQSKVILLPGLSAEWVGQELLIPAKIKEIGRNKEWIDGVFNYRNESIKTVWEEVERQFDIKVLYEGDLQRKYSGVFSNRDLSKALDGICGPMGLKYKFNKVKQELEIY